MSLLRVPSRFGILLFVTAILIPPAQAAAAAAFPVEETSIAQLSAAYASGHTTVHEVVQAHLDRIADLHRPFEQQDQPRDEVVHHLLQPEAQAEA